MPRRSPISVLDIVRNENGLLPTSNASGLYRAFVKDSNDPEKRLRLRVFIPAIHPDNTPVGSLPWADCCSPTAGPNRAALKVPSIDDVVWVGFEMGDKRYPIWLGSWWGAPNGQSELPEVIRQNADKHYLIQTDSGHKIDISEDSSNSSISIISSGGSKIVIDNSNNTIDIQGSLAVNVTISGNSVTINGATNIPGTPQVTGGFCALPNCLFTGAPHLTNKVN